MACFRLEYGARLGRSRTGPGNASANDPDKRAFRPGLSRRPASRLGGMMRAIPPRTWAWLRRRSALALLVATLVGLAAGGVAWLADADMIADAAWLASAACGLGYAVWSAAESLRRGRLGVDIVALLALAGAVAVGELLAAAVISVMLASGRSLEAWAAERARHDLNALLARAPRTARRYRGESLETVCDAEEPHYGQRSRPARHQTGRNSAPSGTAFTGRLPSVVPSVERRSRGG
jgi:hypothetical protein